MKIKRMKRGLLVYSMLFAAISVHELGHYAAARAYGVPVKEFGIGVGPELAAYTLPSGTRLTLKFIPIAGFNSLNVEDAPAFSTRVTLVRSLVISSAGVVLSMLSSFSAYLLLAFRRRENKDGYWKRSVISAIRDSVVLPFRLLKGVGAKFVKSPPQLLGQFGGPATLIAWLMDDEQELIESYARLNVSLVVMNLLPLIGLDGGQILLACVSAFFGQGTAIWAMLLMLPFVLMLLVAIIRRDVGTLSGKRD